MERLSDRSKDEKTIFALAEAYDLAWNSGDVEKLLSFFVSDAVIVNPKGEVTKSKEQFGKDINELLIGSFMERVLTYPQQLWI